MVHSCWVLCPQAREESKNGEKEWEWEKEGGVDSQAQMMSEQGGTSDSRPVQFVFIYKYKYIYNIYNINIYNI